MKSLLFFCALTALSAQEYGPVFLAPAAKEMTVITGALPVNAKSDAPELGIRLKDLASIDGVRDNQLNGIGVVVGLAGTGDSGAATNRMLTSFLEKRNFRVNADDLKSRNVAMVAVTADLPAFARIGTRLTTRISCIGSANSLKGGTLLQTFLVAGNGDIYAAAQGSITIGGAGKAGPGILPTGADHANQETVGQLQPGAIVEREVPTTLLYGEELRLLLKKPDFTTARRVADRLEKAFGTQRVVARDAAMVALRFPKNTSDTELSKALEVLEQLRVQPDLPAKVVINTHTGTVVVGRDVRISPVAVSHGGLSLQILPRRQYKPDPQDPKKLMESISWQNPVTGLDSPLVPAGIRAAASNTPGSLTVLDGTTVEEVANALNSIGARPRDLEAIFSALKSAGVLHAELEIL